MRGHCSRHRNHKMQKSKGIVCCAFSRQERDDSAAMTHLVRGSQREAERPKGQDTSYRPSEAPGRTAGGILM